MKPKNKSLLIGGIGGFLGGWMGSMAGSATTWINVCVGIVEAVLIIFLINGMFNKKE